MGCLSNRLIVCDRDDEVWEAGYGAPQDACVWGHEAALGEEGANGGDGNACDEGHGGKNREEEDMDGRCEDDTAGVHKEGR